jgi:hypothetical protein
MSSFMCAADHLRALATYATDRRPQHLSIRFPVAIGAEIRRLESEGFSVGDYFMKILSDANIAGMGARYAGRVETSPAAPMFALRRTPRTLRGLACIVRWAQCYIYQCAETDDFEDLPGVQLAQAVQANAREMMESIVLPENENVWSYDPKHAEGGPTR